MIGGVTRYCGLTLNMERSGPYQKLLIPNASRPSGQQPGSRLWNQARPGRNSSLRHAGDTARERDEETPLKPHSVQEQSGTLGPTSKDVNVKTSGETKAAAY